jgi:hypothetical protein
VIVENQLGWGVDCTSIAPCKESKKQTDAQTGRREAITPAVYRMKAPLQAVEASCQPLASRNKTYYGCEKYTLYRSLQCYEAANVLFVYRRCAFAGCNIRVSDEHLNDGFTTNKSTMPFTLLFFVMAFSGVGARHSDFSDSSLLLTMAIVLFLLAYE